MAAHHLEIRDPVTDERVPFDGNYGALHFVRGLSSELWDTDHWTVRRLLSAKDGGRNLIPQLRIARDPEPQPPAPPPTSENTEEPPVDRRPSGKRRRGRP